MDSNSNSKVVDLNSKLLSNASTPIKIKTSKKWVLPPRPKPGRKPSQCAPKSHNGSTDSTNQNISTKYHTSHPITPNSSGNSGTISRTNSENHVLPHGGGVQKKTIKKKERKPSIHGISTTLGSSPAKAMSIISPQKTSIAPKSLQASNFNIASQQKIPPNPNSYHKNSSSHGNTKSHNNDKISSETNRSNTADNNSTAINSTNDAPNWDDESILKDPVKQKILKINEENYYLKLQVIKLVSDLKKLKKQNGTGVSNNDSKNSGNGNKNSAGNNNSNNKCSNTSVLANSTNNANNNTTTTSNANIPLQIKSPLSPSAPVSMSGKLSGPVSTVPEVIASTVAKPSSPSDTLKGKMITSNAIHDQQINENISNKNISNTLPTVKLEATVSQDQQKISQNATTTTKVKEADMDDLILSLIDLNHSNDDKQSSTQSPQTPQRHQFQPNTPKQSLHSSNTSSPVQANKSKLIDIPTASSTNVVTEIYDELSIFNNLIIKNNSKLKVFAHNYNGNAINSEPLTSPLTTKKRGRDKEIELEHDALKQKKKLETGFGYHDFSTYDTNSTVISTMLSPHDEATSGNSVDSPTSHDNLTTTTPTTIATTTGSSLYEYDNDYYGFGDANEVEVEFENFINGRLM